MTRLVKKLGDDKIRRVDEPDVPSGAPAVGNAVFDAIGTRIRRVDEPDVPSGAPAVGNAIFDAIGTRIRRLPMTPTNVMEAIKSA